MHIAHFLCRNPLLYALFVFFRRRTLPRKSPDLRGKRHSRKKCEKNFLPLPLSLPSPSFPLSFLPRREKKETPRLPPGFGSERKGINNEETIVSGAVCADRKKPPAVKAGRLFFYSCSRAAWLLPTPRLIPTVFSVSQDSAGSPCSTAVRQCRAILHGSFRSPGRRTSARQ